MKNVLMTCFFMLLSVSAWAQIYEIPKDIDFKENYLSDATVTVASEENNQEMEERTISFIDSTPEVFNISGYSKGTYIITITTPRGTYLSGTFKIE